MAFNIRDFATKVAERGIQRNNKFKVVIPLPRNLDRFDQDQFLDTYPGTQGQIFQSVQRNLEFWTDAANIPGVMLSLRQLHHIGYGNVIKKPIAPVFNDITFSIMNDGGSDNLKHFHAWIQYINNFNTSDGMNDNSTLYELRYLNDYQTTIDLYQYNDAGQENLHIVIQEAYPIHVGDLPLNWADNANLQRVPVTFTFRSWHNHDITPNDLRDRPSARPPAVNQTPPGTG